MSALGQKQTRAVHMGVSL